MSHSAFVRTFRLKKKFFVNLFFLAVKLNNGHWKWLGSCWTFWMKSLLFYFRFICLFVRPFFSILGSFVRLFVPSFLFSFRLFFCSSLLFYFSFVCSFVRHFFSIFVSFVRLAIVFLGLEQEKCARYVCGGKERIIRKNENFLF